MDPVTRLNLDDLRSEDKELQNKAFFYILKATDHPVDWAYEAWDELVGLLRSPDNHERAIAAQVLCNLAKSDPKAALLREIEEIAAKVDPAYDSLRDDSRFPRFLRAIGLE